MCISGFLSSFLELMSTEMASCWLSLFLFLFSLSLSLSHCTHCIFFSCMHGVAWHGIKVSGCLAFFLFYQVRYYSR